MLVVAEHRDGVLGGADELDDGRAVGPLPDEVADEHEQVVRIRVERRDQAIEFRGAAVDVADDVDRLSGRRVDPAVAGRDRVVEVGVAHPPRANGRRTIPTARVGGAGFHGRREAPVGIRSCYDQPVPDSSTTYTAGTVDGRARAPDKRIYAPPTW